VFRVATVGVGLETSVGSEWEEGLGKTNHDERRGSFS